MPLLLALTLATLPMGASARLAPAPLALYQITWQRQVVAPAPMEIDPLEPGGAVVEPGTGLVLFGTRDGWLHAYRPDGKVVWEFQAEGAFPAPPAVAGDTVYVGSTDGRLYALALATGKERWRYQAGEEVGTTPVIAGGAVYVASLQDTVFAVDAATGAWRWHHRRPGKASGFTIRGAARVVARQGTIFAGYSDGYVTALDAANGQVRWERPVAPAGDYLDIDSLVVEGDRLFAAAYSGAVLALDPASGQQVWSFRAAGAARVAVRGGLVAVVSVDKVYGLARDTGAPLWTAPLDGAPGAAPAFAGPWLVIPAGRGGLRFLEAASGRTVRVFDPGSGVNAAPGVNGRRVYVLSNGGTLYALDLL